MSWCNTETGVPALVRLPRCLLSTLHTTVALFVGASAPRIDILQGVRLQGAQASRAVDSHGLEAVIEQHPLYFHSPAYVTATDRRMTSATLPVRCSGTVMSSMLLLSHRGPEYIECRHQAASSESPV